MLNRLFPRYARTWILRVRDDERGIGIVFAVFVASLVFILGAGWTQIATHQVSSTGFQRNREQAIEAAEAGIYRAITLISQDRTTTSITLTSLDQSTTRYGQYEVTIATDPLNSNRRIITSTGYGPRQGSALEAARTIEATVELLPEDSFEHALFASEATSAGFGGDEITLGTSALITGGIFSSGAVTWGSSSTISGDVESWARIKSQGTVQGNLTSAGRVGNGALVTGCPNTGGCNVWVKSGTVQGNVYAADDPSTSGTSESYVEINPNGSTGSDPQPQVQGDVYTELPSSSSPVATVSTRTPGGAVTGTIQYGVPSIPPPKRLLPSFDWNTNPSTSHVAEDFAGVRLDYASTSAWDTYFRANYLTGLVGAHEITVTSGDVVLGGQWGLSCPGVPPLCTTASSFALLGDTTIYTDRPVKLKADVTNTLGNPIQFVIVSTYTGGNAVEFTTGVSIPSTVSFLVYAPSNAVTFDSSADSILNGAVYAKSITDAGSLRVDEGDLDDVSGFTWPVVDYTDIEVVNLREVPTP